MKKVNVSIEDSFCGAFRGVLLDNKSDSMKQVPVRVTSRKHGYYKCGEIVYVHYHRVYLNHRQLQYKVLFLGRPEFIVE